MKTRSPFDSVEKNDVELREMFENEPLGSVTDILMSLFTSFHWNVYYAYSYKFKPLQFHTFMYHKLIWTTHPLSFYLQLCCPTQAHRERYYSLF